MSTPEYQKEKYDNVSFKVPKGKSLEYKQAAQDFGMGQSEMFRLAVEKFIAEQSLQDLPVRIIKPASTKTPPPVAISAADKRLVEEFNQLPADVQKKTLALIRAINESKGGGDND